MLAESGENGRFAELTSRQRRAIPYLVAAPSYEAGCKRAGIGRRTLGDWLTDETFLRMLREAEGRAYRSSLSEVERSITRAARTLRNLLNSKSEAIRLRASGELLAYAFKSREAGAVEDRLAAVEAKVTFGPGPRSTTQRAAQ